MISGQSSESDDVYQTPLEVVEHEDERESVMQPPVHPLPSMQGAFEESIVESTAADETVLPSSGADAEARRQDLLEARQYDDSCNSRWKQRATARYHPLLKLMAQIVFGMHLLQEEQAKSDGEVVKILQTHVNEVDSFLERTSEDFGLAITDIEERIGHLRLPLEHVEVFNSMLEDKDFRTQLLEGNAKIEKIIDRTAKAMNGALADVQHGIQATQELGKYLHESQDRWPMSNASVADVHGAMGGNQQGWLKFLQELQAKGKKLGTSLVQLATLIGEMSRLAAAASRRSIPARRNASPTRSTRSTRSLPVTSSQLRSRFTNSQPPPMPQNTAILNKPLPQAPGMKSHPVPFAQRYEQPRQSPAPSVAPSGRRIVSMPQQAIPPRPKTAGAPRDARQTEGSTADLADFLKRSNPLGSNPNPLRSNPNPLRSNPPGQGISPAPRDMSRGARARSQGAHDLMSAAADAQAAVAKSKGHGAAVIVTGRRGQSRPSSRGGDKALDDGANSRKDSVASSGFARRMSTRMKNFRTSEDNDPSARNPGAIAPTDSAYSSGNEKMTTVPETPQTPRTARSARPPSRLGLFPRVTESAAPNPDLAGVERSASTIGASTRSLASNKPSKSRGLSLRNIFHRRDRSQMSDVR
ncbi:hypothetical protein LTR78_008719 [Recurvomyces mirabilis]|uniref:Uncharacterized protein n=1 Tax=Recurvomyces mirabilis TaxID=574656 RepID=A0AAE0TQL1_9PEZI|nr:hypothetical protein LTR78_008719 [Recurvomyces mirabilis]KAK5159196.1 hypothetical protein LTS14_002338 [Recurvomyces mirabilis]